MNRFTLILSAALFMSVQAHAGIISSDPSQTTYAEVKTFLHELARAHPGTTTTFELGVTDSGDTVEGVKIGNGPVKNLVVSTHHGNEYGSTEVARAVAANLAENPIPGQTVYVIPVLNITGYNAKLREEVSDGSYHDPNRDYPGPCGTEGPHKLKSTALLAAFVDREGIVASATLHTFYPAVVYPWGLASHDLSTPYDDQFKQLVNLATQESHYQVGNSTEVIYAANGTYEDYAFWKHGIWSILFELGNSHNPVQADVDEMIRVNVPGMRRMLEQAPKERATNHAFSGKCDGRLGRFDRHDE
ncbi:MAG: succinylglutamate desuccinylase/aspartoacylase family protein [Deltaproteobacteria bacterium]|nr:succinylglutamate desuccinylase/aspartoacylase family protein [Deltaproteobacteria bacterium]